MKGQSVFATGPFLSACLLAGSTPSHAAQALPMILPHPGHVTATWDLQGDPSVRPAQVRDDGLRTYLAWRPEQSLPAVFAIGPTGAEEVVDGYMRGDLFVIDRVHARLVFRIDRDRAVAIRRERRR